MILKVHYRSCIQSEGTLIQTFLLLLPNYSHCLRFKGKELQIPCKCSSTFDAFLPVGKTEVMVHLHLTAEHW